MFSIKTEDSLTDCLGCEFHTNRIRTKGWLGQPLIIKTLEKIFGKKAVMHRFGLTPVITRFVAMRVTEDQDKLSKMQFT